MGRGSKIALALTALAGAGIGLYLYASGSLSSLLGTSTGLTTPEYGVAGPTYTQVTPTPTDTSTPISNTPFDWSTFLKSLVGTQQSVPSLYGNQGASGGVSSGGIDLSWLQDLLKNLGKTTSDTNNAISNPSTPIPTPVPQPSTVPTNTPSQTQQVVAYTNPAQAWLGSGLSGLEWLGGTSLVGLVSGGGIRSVVNYLWQNTPSPFPTVTTQVTTYTPQQVMVQQTQSAFNTSYVQGSTVPYVVPVQNHPLGAHLQ